MPEPAVTPSVSKRVARVLTSEQGIYGLILISGMIVVSNSTVGTSANAVVSVAVTAVVFFLAHVYAGTLSRLGAEEGHGDVAVSVRGAMRHSAGLLVVAVLPVAILLLGVVGVLDDEASIWVALGFDVVVLGVLGWFAVARWSASVWGRLLGALITAGFGAVVMALKALTHG